MLNSIFTNSTEQPVVRNLPAIIPQQTETAGMNSSEEELRQKIAELDAAIQKAAQNAAIAEVELGAIPARIEQAFIADDDTRADELEAEGAKLRRVVAKAKLVMPILRNELLASQEKFRAERIKHHRAKAEKAFDRMVRGLEVALAARKEAEDAWIEARREMGGYAEMHVPRPFYQGVLNAETVAHWKAALEIELLRRPRAQAPEVEGTTIRVLHRFGPYVPGDTISLPDAEASKAVHRGLVEVVSAEDLQRLMPPKVEPPPPDEFGRVSVVFVSSFFNPGTERFRTKGGFTIGDVASFPINEALILVNRGVAQFVRPE